MTLIVSLLYHLFLYRRCPCTRVDFVPIYISLSFIVLLQRCCTGLNFVPRSSCCVACTKIFLKLVYFVSIVFCGKNLSRIGNIFVHDIFTSKSFPYWYIYIIILFVPVTLVLYTNNYRSNIGVIVRIS